jgi:hypothetical protein
LPGSSNLPESTKEQYNNPGTKKPIHEQINKLSAAQLWLRNYLSGKVNHYHYLQNISINNFITLISIVPFLISSPRKLIILSLQTSLQENRDSDASSTEEYVSDHSGEIPWSILGEIEIWRVDLGDVAHHVYYGDCGGAFFNRTWELH